MSSTLLELERLFKESQYHAAISLAKGTNISPESDPRSTYVLAACLFRVGEYSASYELLHQIESAMSGDAAYLSLMGAALRRLGRLKEAKSFLETAYEIQPESLTVRNNLANLLIDLSDLEKAEHLLDSILKESPEYPDALINKSRLLSIKNSPAPKSSTTSNNFASTLDDDPLMLAFTEEEVEKFGRIKTSKSDSTLKQTVAEVTQKFLNDSGSNTNAVENMRLIERCIAENNISFALELADKYIQQNGFNVAICDCVADALVKAKSYQYAEIYTLHFCQLHEPSPKHLINLCSFALRRNDYCIANLHFQKLVLLDPQNPNISTMQSHLDKLKGRSLANSSIFTFKSML